ncbi:MAG: tRNA (adenosine(37)-N6)-threonylcarbamoyltransferase complex dimerization subunit type 1 TsaB [Treponema sp.]|nr:tRNA (adenosine(37)-N6)-threonylcarbamoyltransferase complex dimerization subunit type 1 TsaB [Treponema sp.]
MNILALDTATDILSVALKTASGTWYMESDAGLHHSERLLSMIDTLLIQSGTQKQDINLLACMEGPGSFTGLRIGFATVKGMAAALNIPFTAIPTLDCMAYSWGTWPGYVLPVIDAKKHCFFWALYQKGRRITDFFDSPLSDVLHAIKDNAEQPLLITGIDAELAYKTLQTEYTSQLPSDKVLLNPMFRKGNAKELLVLAENRFRIEGKGCEDNAGPVYLRKSDAEIAMGV